jgi:hypothetical protein
MLVAAERALAPRPGAGVGRDGAGLSRLPAAVARLVPRLRREGW